MRILKKAAIGVVIITSIGCSTTNMEKSIKQPSSEATQESRKHTDVDAAELYNELKLLNVIPKQAFINGYKMAANSKFSNGILVIIDFTKHSAKKRFFVIDLKERKLSHSTYVSHGLNSGGSYANVFSNELDSNKTSLGFMVTNETYFGKNGFSLRLDGMIKGLNDNLRRRHIVIHSSAYANQDFIEVNHRLGRSNGCFAIPEDVAGEIIKMIKGGAIVYSYHDGVIR
jgi:hypothetical protein